MQLMLQEKQGRLNQLIKLYFKAEEAKFVVQSAILAEVQRDKLYEETHPTFEAFCQDLFDIQADMARKQINALTAAYNIGLVKTLTIDTNYEEIVSIEQDFTKGTQLTEWLLRPLVSYNKDPNLQRDIWHEVISTKNGRITAAHVEHCVKIVLERKEASKRKFYTVTEWNQLPDEVKRAVLNQREGDAKFNQTNDNVEWALWTWNPITGCLHNCPYCYARDIANRFYDYLPLEERFTPVFYPNRLLAPRNTKQPDLNQVTDPVQRMGLKNVFVCSMADLFGKWVPTEWIEAVLEQVKNNPQWNFLFLTKFPIRMAEFEYPPNVWLGTSVDHQWAVERAEKAFTKIKQSGFGGICWLSCEPMMERLTFTSLDMFDWVVIGGASRSTQTPEFRPPREWVNHLWEQADSAGCKVYEKTNLLERRREYPGF